MPEGFDRFPQNNSIPAKHLPNAPVLYYNIYYNTQNSKLGCYVPMLTIPARE